MKIEDTKNDNILQKQKMVAALMGFSIDKKRWTSFLFPISGSVLFIMMILAFFAIVKNWKYFNSRFQAIEDFIVLVFAVSLMLELGLRPGNFMIRLDTMEREFYIGAGPLSEEQIKLRKEIIENRRSTHEKFAVIIIVFITINFVLPVIFGIIQLQARGSRILESHELPMTFECWIPVPIESTFYYLILCAFQAVGMLNFSCCCYLWFCSTTLSLSAIKYDIRVLCLYIKEMDKRVGMMDLDSSGRSITKYSKEKEVILRTYFGHIIKYHQSIKRNVKTLNDALSTLLFVFNQACTIQCCVALYGCIEEQEFSQKLKYGLLMIIVFRCLTLFCWFGQQLKNEGEELYLTYAQCSWIGKPLWFKKSLNMILTCSRQPLQVMPLGLYVLNFDNMRAVLQAAYSYFNLMHSTNKKN